MLPSLALPALADPSPALMAFLAALADDEADYQSAVLQARQYHDGEQFVALTDRLRQFLGGDTANTGEDWKRLRLNICRTVVNAVVERLTVAGFDATERAVQIVGEDGQPQTVKPTAAWAWRVWQQNRMDATQRRVHEGCVKESEYFVIVDWDNNTARPRFTPHQRYIDGGVGGDGQGCKAFYRNDDPDQDLLFVTKRWVQVTIANGRRDQRQRLTVYYPDRIEKYAGFPGSWRPVVDDDREPWPIPWTDRTGRPLGIPVAHFRNSAGMEAREAWPVQNAINKAFVDLMAESDMSAFRVLIAFGWKPVDADGNTLDITPGVWMGTERKDATAMNVPGVDLSNFLNLIENLIFWAASVTDTPVTRFITTKQVSSEGSQKETIEPLLTKVGQRAGEIGNGWESALDIARRLENTFGRGGLNEGVELFTTWAPFQARDETAELQRAQIRKQLGMPIALIGPALGLTPEQVTLWEDEVERMRANALALAQASTPAPAPAPGALRREVQRDGNGRIAAVVERRD